MSVTGVGEPMGVPTYSTSGEINFLGGKCEPAPKSCQALGPEVRNSKEEEETESVRGGGTLRTSWKPRPRGIGEGAIVKQESRIPSLGVRELQNWEPDRELSSLSEGPTFSLQRTAGPF